MNIYHLEYFIVLAETLNYTKASEKLNITQPNLSKSIVNIERQIDIKLFERNKRDVKLTLAGETFYTEIKKTLTAYDDAIKRAKEIQDGMYERLSVGFLGTAVVRLFPTILKEFSEHNPNIKVEILDYSYSTLVSALHQKEVDIAILPNNELRSISNIIKRPLYSDDMCVVVHKDHPFAKRESISIKEIKGQPFVHMQQKSSLRDYNLINSICNEYGFSPNTVYKSNSIINMLMMVECRVGITILAKHMHHFATDNVKFIKIEEYTNFFDLICAWREPTSNAINKFIETLDDIFPQEDFNK